MNRGRPHRSPIAGMAVAEPGKPLGRRLFLLVVSGGALGVVFGNRLEGAVAKLTAPVTDVAGGGLGGLIPGAARFRIYTVTGALPHIPRDRYRLEVTGLVKRPRTWTYGELEALPRTQLIRTFQCVTGWQVPGVEWAGVGLGKLVDLAEPRPEADAVELESYDGAYTESLTLEEARRSDVLVAYEMLGAPITREHGGPVRLYVAPMYGYKSIKWLRSVRLVRRARPGFWEQQGYPVEAWIGGSHAPG